MNGENLRLSLYPSFNMEPTYVDISNVHDTRVRTLDRMNFSGTLFQKHIQEKFPWDILSK